MHACDSKDFENAKVWNRQRKRNWFEKLRLLKNRMQIQIQ